MTTPTRSTEELAVLQRLSLLDRFLPVWILLAMALGLGLGRLIPELNDALDTIKIGSVSLPIALGLLAMMYPVLAKVRYSRVAEVAADRTMLATSLMLNWLIGPALMFALAWLLLPDLPEYRTGLIIIGLARCIAMVLIWNDLAGGDSEAAVVLVALNSMFQIVAFSFLGYFYLQVLPGWLGLDTDLLDVSLWEIARIVLVFLGIPLVAGFLTREWGERTRGIEWYEKRFIPKIAPWALWGLLFTVIVLFALQGETVTAKPLDVARIALPLLAYFGLMWVVSFALGLRLGFGYARNTTLAFTAASNNFELAIAVTIGVFGVTSGQALAGVVGPLIEVPVLVGLVYVALWARGRFYTEKARAKPRVLFLCVHNAGRSQMAAGWLRHLAGNAVDVYSGGSEPAPEVNPVAVKAMAEVGIDITAEPPSRWTEGIVCAADVVVTMGCGDSCPVYPGKRYEDWELTDPAGQLIEEVRKVRDQIERRVRRLMADLDIPARA